MYIYCALLCVKSEHHLEGFSRVQSVVISGTNPSLPASWSLYSVSLCIAIVQTNLTTHTILANGASGHALLL